MGTLSFKSTAFDGVNDHALGTDIYDFDHNVPFSVSCWFRTTDNNGYLVSKMEATPRGWGVHVDASGSFQFVFFNNGGNAIQVATSATGYDDNVWHFAIATYSGNGLASGVTLYVDGASKTKASPIFDNLVGLTTVNAAAWQVNGRTGANVLLTASIDWVAIYDKALTAGEVTTIYNNADPVDHRVTGPTANLLAFCPMGDLARFVSPFGLRNLVRNGIAANPVPDADFSRSAHAILNTNVSGLDISTDNPGGICNFSLSPNGGGIERYEVLAADVHPSIKAFGPGVPFSVSFWWKGNAAGGAAVLGSMDGAFTRGWYVTSTSDGGGGQIGFIIEDDQGGNERVWVRTATNEQDDTWRHYAMVYDGSVPVTAASVTVYRNAVDAGTTIDDTFPADGTFHNDESFQVSGVDGTNAVMPNNTFLAEPIVFSRALTAPQVTALYNGGSPPVIDVLGDPDIRFYLRTGEGRDDLTMTGMAAADIETGGAGFYTTEELAEPALVGLVKETDVPFNVIGGAGGGGPTIITYYKMRGEADPGPGFVVWINQNTADFAGTNAPSAVIPGTVVVLDTWQV